MSVSTARFGAKGAKLSGGGECGVEDAAIVAAVQLLATHGIDVPIASVRVMPLPGPGDIADVSGVRCRGGESLIIRVSPVSDVYLAALDGQPVGLAATLVHELFHIAHGPDEGPAYAAHLEFLVKVSAPRRFIDDVVRIAATNDVMLDVD